ncbi:MAG: ATP-binding protein [Candidatus Kapabacteria bacterium]|jgi:signal transduction histidine kinase|nr:ATP-binding protein [Candidatus Kapabacteria bacterium]
MKRRFGIQLKFVSLVLVLLVSIAVFIAAFFPERQKIQMNKYLNDKVIVTAQMTAFNASTGLEFADDDAVKRTLEVLPQLTGVKFVLVYNLEGREIAGYKPDSTYRTLSTDITRILQSDVKPDNKEIYDVGEVALHAEPAMYQGRKVGQVIMGTSRDELTRDARQSIYIALGVSAGIVIVGGVIMLILSGRLVKPLKTLESAAEKVSGGDLSTTVQITTNDEVEVLANTFNHMVESIRAALEDVQRSLKKAEEANARKTELLSIVSHDLKSPITSVLAAIKLIEIGDITAEEFPEVGTMIRQLCERMIDLIESLLASSALEMGRIQINKASCDAQELMQRVIDSNNQKATNKFQQIIVQAKGDNFDFVADKGLMQQVLDNFLTNAIKYSPSETTITTRVMATQQAIRFEVQDEGPGLTEEDKQKLFGFFQRLSARPTAGESSHGVGLAITKRVVDLHGGRIWAESEIGKGTTFVVVIPRHHVSTEAH